MLSQARVRGKFALRQCRRFAGGIACYLQGSGERHRTEDTEDMEGVRGGVVGRDQAGSLFHTAEADMLVLLFCKSL